MLNENPNNDFHWKTKLEGLESLPGETLNIEEAWDKLHDRLHKKIANKKVEWFYAAAACLLVALLLPWFLYNKKENIVAKNNAPHNPIQNSNSIQSTLSKKVSVAIISSRVQKKSSLRPVENSNKITTVDHKTLTVENVADKPDKEEFIEREISNAIAPLDTQKNIAAIVPEKKKLRVVHINEMGDPVSESQNVARYYERHSFQIKIINQEVFTSPSLSQSNKEFAIFKSKNAPSN